MNKAIIFLSLMLLTSQVKTQKLSTSQNDINISILSLNNCPCNANLTKDSSPKYSIDDFIAAFNNHDLGAWGTWFYDNAPEEEIDSANYSIPNLKESNSSNFDSLIWITYVCGDISEMAGVATIDSTFQLPIEISAFGCDILETSKSPLQIPITETIDCQEQFHLDSIDHLRSADKTDDIINIGFSIDKFNQENNFDVYPNPVNTTLNILDHLSEIKEIKILDSNGKMIHFDIPKAENSSIDFSRFSPGIYFLIFETEQGSVLRRIIKE